MNLITTQVLIISTNTISYLIVTDTQYLNTADGCVMTSHSLPSFRSQRERARHLKQNSSINRLLMVTKFVRINLFCTQGIYRNRFLYFCNKIKMNLVIHFSLCISLKKKTCIFESASSTGEIHILARGYSTMIVSYSTVLVNKFVSVNKDGLFLCLPR